MKAPRHIVLSLDYELFGNGTGDVRQHVIEPTERMAQLAERYQARLTVFVEVEEYLAFRKCAPALKKDLGYDPAARIEAQIQSLLVRGHDVQLHLHPQWYGARYEQGRWHLRADRPTVDSLFSSQEETDAFIAERVAVLEQLAAAGRSGHKVRAYRAGAFAAQPGARLLPALAAAGIVIESSVVRGLWRRGVTGDLDYRNCPPGKRAWRIRTEVTQEDPSGPLLELPIGARPGRRLQQVTWARLKAKFSRRVPKSQQGAFLDQQLGRRRDPVHLLRYLCQRVPIKFDFHNLAPATLLKWIRAEPAPQDGEPDVVVLIGHTKEHLDDAPFEQLLEGLARDESLSVVTFDSLAGPLAEERIRNVVGAEFHGERDGFLQCRQQPNARR